MFVENNITTNSHYKQTGLHKRPDFLRKAYQSTLPLYLLKGFADADCTQNWSSECLTGNAFADWVCVYMETQHTSNNMHVTIAVLLSGYVYCTKLLCMFALKYFKHINKL